MKKIISLLALLSLFSCASSPESIIQREKIVEVNSDNGLAIKGYDPVSYFTKKQPTQGKEVFTYRHKGLIWKFSSKENLNLFIENPTRYEPQFGGYCSYAMSNGDILDINPNNWAITDDKLYLNNNIVAHKLWKNDMKEKIKSANFNWKIIPKKSFAKK